MPFRRNSALATGLPLSGLAHILVSFLARCLGSNGALWTLLVIAPGALHALGKRNGLGLILSRFRIRVLFVGGHHGVLSVLRTEVRAMPPVRCDSLTCRRLRRFPAPFAWARPGRSHHDPAQCSSDLFVLSGQKPLTL